MLYLNYSEENEMFKPAFSCLFMLQRTQLFSQLILTSVCCWSFRVRLGLYRFEIPFTTKGGQDKRVELYGSYGVLRLS